MQGGVVNLMVKAALVFFRVLAIVMCLIGFVVGCVVTNGLLAVFIYAAVVVWFIYDMTWG